MTDTLYRVSENLFRSKSSGRYYAITKKNGKQIKTSLKTTDHDLAKRKLVRALEEADRLKHTLKSATFADVLKDYRETAQPAKGLKATSLKDEEYRIQAILKAWTGLLHAKVRDITAKDCEKWFGKRLAEIHPQRMNNETSLLKNIFRFAIREGYCHANPADRLRRLKVPKSKVVPPTRQQFSILVDTLRNAKNEDAGDFVELLGYSGMRRNECANIVWVEVDFDRGRFWVTGGDFGVKGNDELEVPLFPAMRELLLRIRARVGHVNPTDKIMRIKQCRNAIEGACRDAKLPRFDHHDMRHFFCSNAIEHGIDFKVIAGWLRQKDGGILVASTYGHLRKDHSDEMAKKMDFSATTIHDNKVIPISKAGQGQS
jgi:integrase